MRIAGLTSRVSLVLTAIALVSPSVAGAQVSAGRMVLTPYVGLYAPSTGLARRLAAGELATLSEVYRHKAAAAVGLNASYWMSERTAIEAGIAYSATDLVNSWTIATSDAMGGAIDREKAHVLMGSVKMMVHLLPAASRFNIRLGVGPAIVSRGGSAYEDAYGKVTGLTDVGGAVSLCTKIPVTSSLGIRLRAEDYLYHAKLRYKAIDPSISHDYGARFQSDVVLSAGLQFLLNR